MKNFITVVIICCVFSRTICFDYSENDVEAKCTDDCPLQVQNRTDKGHYGYACDHTCNIEHCLKGCKFWKEALKSTCRETCNSTTERPNPKELYCVIGCNDAVTKYFSNLRKLLGNPPAPALLADSLKPDSLKLEWNFPQAKKTELSCLLQWQYEEFAASKSSWQYCRNTTWEPESNVFFVQDLQPYTKYRFRIAIIHDSNEGLHYGDLAVSGESVVIITTAGGPPASPPQNVRATPVDSSSISISWEPGPFPHGPLLSYVLNITDNHRSEVKDISPDKSDIVVGDLKALNNYSVQLRMRNKNGSGPPATTMVTTPAERQLTNVAKPPLILGTNTTILELNNLSLDEEPKVLYKSAIELKGIGFHYNRKLLFVTDCDGFVSKIPIYQEDGGFTAWHNKFKPSSFSSSSRKIDILEPHNLDFKPLDITVDWLNDRLYILGEIKFNTAYIIKRCDLDGNNLMVVYAGLSQKPSSIQIDPLNGYLFWVIQDYNNGGFFRLDINDIGNGIPADKKIKKILNETELGAFTLEYHNFNVLVSYQRLNTIMSVSLDGNEIKNIRTTVAKSKLYRVVSLAMENKLFYWTDGTDVYFEDYNEHTKSYYHNALVINYGYYKKVFINSQSSQPWPTPINPPTNVQAIFGRDIAKARWHPPHLVGLQGKGAWQNWSYEISIKETATDHAVVHKNINETFFTISNLKENTEYILKVAAYTNSGRGPWSSDFRGITLNSTKSPVLLWSASEGLLRTNAAGESLEILIDKSAMRNYHYTDIAWYRDQIFMVSNSSFVYWYNTTSRRRGRLEDLDSVGSVAVDWIGAKLYWSNPKQQLIVRGNLNGTEQEPLLTVLAKELNIDSLNAYLYWSTGIKVECAHLNGVERFEYHDVQYFSGKQVMGLTLDFEQKFVYWIVRGSEGSNLYRAKMMGYRENEVPTVEIISGLQKPNIQGSLCYFHKRLLWLQDDKNAAISDLSGKNIASINGKYLRGLNTVYVVDTSLYLLPDPWHQFDVIPKMVDEHSVKVVGSCESFNITWDAVSNVDHGTVFYEIQIINPSKNNDLTVVTTTRPTIKYWLEVTPFTAIDITIRAFTYWASSPLLRTEVTSPSSTPSAPLNLRTFVEYDAHSATVIVRWDSPAHPNGVLRGYKLRCWFVEDDVETELCDNVIDSDNETEYRLETEKNSEEYYFEVQAFTKIGLGAKSLPTSANTAIEHPIPTLLVASKDSIYLYDVDLNETKSLINGINEPKQISYLLNEKSIIWIDKKGEMFKLDTSRESYNKIHDVGTETDDLTIDWIGRRLYYVQKVTDQNRSSVYEVDLSLDVLESVKISESTEGPITRIEVSPFAETLFWIEAVGDAKYKLVRSDITGQNVRNFFDRTTADDGRRNCPYRPEIGPFFAVDHSDVGVRPKIVFLDAYTQSVMWSDEDAESCGLLVDSNYIRDGFPLAHFQADLTTLYWTHDGLLQALNRKEYELITKQVDDVSDMIIYGNHSQPYPPERCLSPEQHNNYTLALATKSFDSLVLKMPEPAIREECRNVTTMASIRYVVYYGKYTDDGSDCSETKTCSVLSTFDSTRVVGDLKAYTEYSMRVSVSNYYTSTNDVIIGPSSIFRTSPGVPSKARNVSATVLGPNLASVTWLPPEELNGVIVYYEIHYQTESTPLGVRQKGELSVNGSSDLTAFLTTLSPNESYAIWVRTYSEANETSNDSDRVEIATYPEPSYLSLINRTAYGMRMSWQPTEHIELYHIEYSLLTTNEWQQIKTLKEENDSVVVSVFNLKPKTHYKFRLRLMYEGNNEEYIWPKDSRFTFETLGDRPSPPGIPIIQYVNPNIYKVLWEASKDNGAPIETYKLEGKVLRYYRVKRSTNRTVPFFNTSPSIELEDTDQWITYYNGTNTSWIINGLNEKYKYAFRVSSLNSYGWSNVSEESNEFDLTEAAASITDKQASINLILIAILVPVSICFCFVMIFTYLVCSGRRSKQKKLQQMVPSLRIPDVELATLRELPKRGVHNTNILYFSAQPTAEELGLLPQIRREQITLTKFLGSGAFGEVFEGKAKGINSANVDTRVAVKTLKKGASDQEKCEFLQEAQLMSHFKHDHILELLGVCLDNDPHFIIMELMEGGDLLTYLRDSRNPSNCTPFLTLIELLKMCVDVSKGCRYLEEMHFVHRDLACRNCLVSSYDTDSRIVKIGDFGLARDIYKNDYYRKEGEALLPVRWMAPESLTDGVFTSQSDVWAFGVLLWEIMTLGQQPYPARANLEVLHYVRRGGRLGQPTDCPDELHSLMLQCWEFEQEKRPTFKYCYEVLENLHRRTLRNPTTGAHEGQYISTVPDLFAGISNEAYFRDENHNSSGSSWKSENEDEAAKEATPFLEKEETSTSKEIHKYLEVILGPDDILENDGYEIPNRMLQKLDGNAANSEKIEDGT